MYNNYSFVHPEEENSGLHIQVMHICKNTQIRSIFPSVMMKYHVMILPNMHFCKYENAYVKLVSHMYRTREEGG